MYQYQPRLKREDLENVLLGVVYEWQSRGIFPTIREIADGAGRSKSPHLRAVLMGLVDDGRLVSWRDPYKSTGIIRFQLSEEWKAGRDSQQELFEDYEYTEEFDCDEWATVEEEENAALWGKAEYPYTDGVVGLTEEEYHAIMFGHGTV